MRQRDDDVRVHDGAADLCLLDILAALYRNGDIVGAFQTVANQNMAAGGEGREAVQIRGFYVVKGVLPAAHIERIAVRQEGLSAQAFYHVSHGFRVVGA